MSRDLSIEPLSFMITCPGKVIIFGELGVPESCPSLVAGLDIRTHLIFKEEIEESFIKIELPDVKLKHIYNLQDLEKCMLNEFPPLTKKSVKRYNWETPELLDIIKIMEEIYVFLKAVKHISKEQEYALIAFFLLFRGIFCAFVLKVYAFSIRIKAEYKVGEGTGSSASYCSCIAAAFLHYIRLRATNEGYHLSKRSITKNKFNKIKFTEVDLTSFSRKERDLITRWCVVCENVFNIYNSGLTVSICTLGGIINCYNAGHGKMRVKTVDSPLHLDIILLKSGARQDKYESRSRFEAFKERYPLVTKCLNNTVDSIIVQAEKVVTQLGKLLAESSINTNIEAEISMKSMKLNYLISLYNHIEFGVGLHHSMTMQLMREIREKFNLLSGFVGLDAAGYGMVFLTPGTPPSKAQALKTFLKEKGVLFIHTKLGGPGIVLINEIFDI